METCNCKSCNEVINENDFIAYNRDGEAFCKSCEQSAWNYANSLIRVANGEIESFKWCDEFGYKDEHWDDVEVQAVPSWTYHRTDGSRGYWKPALADGFISIGSGWATGRYDDVSHKHSFNDLCDAIQEGDSIPPVPVYFAFDLWSNVFSLSADVILHQSHVDTFAEWVSGELGLSLDDIQRALR